MESQGLEDIFQGYRLDPGGKDGKNNQKQDAQTAPRPKTHLYRVFLHVSS